MQNKRVPLRGRGTSENPDNRFETIHIERDEEWDPANDPSPKTQFFKDKTKTFINSNDSPDVGFDHGINPYRGCEHGCVYCYARPSHEYLGFSSGLDFESKILVKEDAPKLLRKELSAKKWKPQVIALSGNTDCYQPIERKLKITRQCLEVLLEFRNPVAIVTKNRLIERDVDLFKELHKYNCITVLISVTTLDRKLAGVLEPRASRPQDRLHAIETLHNAGIPVGVMAAPIIPTINDVEIPALLKAAGKAGAQFAHHIILRLPFANKELFENWLQEHFPDRKKKVLNRIRNIRDGKLNSSEFGTRMRGKGIFAEQIHDLFDVSYRKAGIPGNHAELSTEFFRKPSDQLTLFF